MHPTSTFWAVDQARILRTQELGLFIQNRMLAGTSTSQGLHKKHTLLLHLTYSLCHSLPSFGAKWALLLVTMTSGKCV